MISHDLVELGGEAQPSEDDECAIREVRVGGERRGSRVIDPRRRHDLAQPLRMLLRHVHPLPGALARPRLRRGLSAARAVEEPQLI